MPHVEFTRHYIYNRVFQQRILSTIHIMSTNQHFTRLRQILLKAIDDKYKLETIEEPRHSTDEVAKFNQSLPNDQPILSYFYQFYHYYLKGYEDTLLKPDDEDPHLIPIIFHEYDHPTWENWKEIWGRPPIVLDTKFIENPTPEFSFKSTLFRLQLEPIYFFGRRDEYQFYQGSTIVFEGYEDSNVRFIVEWCQWLNCHNAYLKVVGVDSSGNYFPFSDPDYPTFILLVPQCLSKVPTPSPAISFTSLTPLTLDEMESMKDFEFCWACNNGFF